MAMNLDNSVDKLVEEVVLEGLKELVQARAEVILIEMTGDEEFTNKVDELAAEAVNRSLEPQKRVEYKYKTVDQFVDGFIRRQYAITAHQDGRVNWAKEWYRHPEAVVRFHTLWRSYERARQADPNGFLEEFLRVKADYHMKEIMKDRGVFASCQSSDVASIPLPATPAPESDESKETE